MSIDDKLKTDILTSIALEGSVTSSEISVIIASRSQGRALLSFASGLPKVIHPDRFTLILSKPFLLSSLHQFHFRCCLCGEVISFPAWYLHQKFAVNSIHYFVCFNGSQSVNARCYRKGE